MSARTALSGEQARSRAVVAGPDDSTQSGEHDLPLDDDAPRRHEVLGLVALAATLLTALALASYDARGGENWIGSAGAAVAGGLASALGLGAWVVALELGLLASRLFQRRSDPVGVGRTASTLVLALVGCALAHLALPGREVLGGHLPGGAVGEVVGEILRASFGLVGAFVLGSTVALVVLVLRTSLSVVEVSRRVLTALREGWRAVSEGARSLWTAYLEAREIERQEREDEERRNAPRIVVSSAGQLAAEAPLEGAPRRRGKPPTTISEADPTGSPLDLDPHASLDGSLGPVSEPPLDSDASLTPPDLVAPKLVAATARKAAIAGPAPNVGEPAAVATPSVEVPAPARGARASGATARTARAAASAEVPVERAQVEADASVVEAPAPTPRADAPAPLRGPTIVAPVRTPPPDARPALTADARPAKGAAVFALPPTALLDAPREQALEIDEKTLRENATRLVEKLGAYGVRGRVDEIHPGPVVTMYELEPEAGTKVSKIAALSDDLAMALAAQKVRIVAPIPGKARVGFELPNRHRQMVALREILEDARWHESKAALPVAFGKDIAGQPVYGDLAKMPHLLVAGATGSGKSVGLNVMLASLLMKRTPEDVRLLMIDPKVVELAVFDGIPHMLLPVVTDMKKAALALRWAVDEMERRYQLFADAGARNIVTYNERVEKVLRGEMPPEKLCPKKHGKQVARGVDGEEVLVDPVDGERADALPMPTKLPYVVCVVDEFADLMMVAAKDVEAAIARLAQKARAAGIHVILATQRPSVDVITGMIKANFPARIAFKVSQREDSKTILGRNGAEHLLGHGDMLMIPPGASDLKRVHSAFISEDEVQAVCDHLRAQGAPVYDENIVKPRDDEDGEGEGGSEPAADAAGGGESGLYDRAVAIVAQAGYCSISHLQRQLGLGYNRAAKLVERMEKDGVVGPASGKAGGRREVLVQAL